MGRGADFSGGPGRFSIQGDWRGTPRVAREALLCGGPIRAHTYISYFPVDPGDTWIDGDRLPIRPCRPWQSYGSLVTRQLIVGIMTHISLNQLLARWELGRMTECP